LKIGIGNDSESWSFDGSTQRAWTSNSSQKFGEYWSQGWPFKISIIILGDVIGCILDLDNKTITYFRNGNELGAAFNGITVGKNCHFGYLTNQDKDYILQ
jgi:Kip1 ubiquitination-promoting complex protein 1